MQNLEKQIKAIEQKILTGKAKNKWAAVNKIKSIKKQIISIQREQKLFNYLAQ